MRARHRLKSLSGHIGAELSGLDFNALADEDIEFIQQSLIEHLLVVVRDQKIDAATLDRIGRQLGETTLYPFVAGLDDFPEIVEIIKRPEDTTNFGGVWHSDTAYLPEPAMGALLYAEVVPDNGGDTLFANMYNVFDSLSPGLKAFLSAQTAVNNADNEAIAQTRPGQPKKGLTATHPAVRTHPVTGRKLLYVNRAHTTHFMGMTKAESAPVLDYLFNQIEAPEFSVRLQWAPGTIAFWDNRACQHFPINDYNGQYRKMLRISLAGERPY